MADLYAELITDINKTIDPLENGELTVAKAKYATSADTADNAGNCESANTADRANSVNNATFASVVPDMGIPLFGSCRIDSGQNSSYTLAEDGVYLVVYDCKYVSTYTYNRTLCGVMVVNGSATVDCPLSHRNNTMFGATLRYRPEDAFPIEIITLGTYGGTVREKSNGTLYFYKIGTLEEKG